MVNGVWTTRRPAGLRRRVVLRSVTQGLRGGVWLSCFNPLIATKRQLPQLRQLSRLCPSSMLPLVYNLAQQLSDDVSPATMRMMQNLNVEKHVYILHHCVRPVLHSLS